MNKRKIRLIRLFFAILLIITVIGATMVGSAKLSFTDSLRIVCSRIPILSDLVSVEGIKSNYISIIWKVRIPRIMLSGLSGASLALVGACFQGLFRNPLADPQILGVSSGAALGATIASLSGISVTFLGLGVTGIFAFILALSTVMLVYKISVIGGSQSTIYIILTGTAVSSMLSAIIALLMSLHREQLEKVYLWTLGSFATANDKKVWFLLCFLVVCGGIILTFTRELNIIATGKEAAESLGVDTGKVLKILIIMASLLVAACVSVSGIIGFVGLIIPHAIRLIIGPKHERLMPLTLIVGAIFMILCDTLARTLRAPGELPVGVITALFGAPYFIMLLYRSRKRMV